MSWKKQGIRFGVAAAVVASSALGGGAGPAVALASVSSALEQSNWDENRVRTGLEEAGVTPEVQDRLIIELLAGNLWDSLDGSAPVSEVTKTEPNDHGGRSVRTVYTYADGSAAVSTIDVPTEPADGIGVRAVDTCTLGSGVGNFKFWGCRISWDTAATSIDWWADGQTSNIGQANISFKGEGGYWCALCTAGKPRWSVHRLTQAGSLPAQVAWVVPVTWYGGAGSGVISVGIKVANTIVDYQGT